MKLVTIFIVCAIATLPNSVKTQVSQVVELTLGDPKIIHARRNQEKILYWEYIRRSNDYPVDDWINQLSSRYLSFTVYSVTHMESRFHEKNGWWLGIMSTVIMSVILGVWGYYQQNRL